MFLRLHRWKDEIQNAAGGKFQLSVLTDACNTLIGQDSRPTLKKNETKLSQNLTKNEKQKKIIKIYKKGREKKFNIKDT